MSLFEICLFRSYDLRKNGFLRCICLETWSTVGGAVWEKLGDAVLLEEVCHCGQALRSQKTHEVPIVSSLPSACIGQDVSIKMQPGAAESSCHMPFLHHHGL